MEWPAPPSGSPPGGEDNYAFWQGIHLLGPQEDGAEGAGVTTAPPDQH